MEFDNKLKRISETYYFNIEEIEKELLKIGINIKRNEKEYKSFFEVLEELSVQWETLSTHNNRFIKKWICKVIAGIRDMNFFNVFMNKKIIKSFKTQKKGEQ